MAANGRGHMRPNTGSKTPPFLIVGLLIVTGILAFNYWNVSSKNSQLSVEVEELGIKYRSTQNKKIDVERRNDEFQGEINKLNQQLKDKEQQVDDEQRKTQEMSDKIDRLAQEMDAVRNDLNTCDDEVGFCHENVTRMVIAHRKQLDDLQIRCRQDIDEAQSHGEQRAASVQSDCESAIDAKRISILKVVQQVFGTKAIVLLKEQSQLDVSGIDLTIQTEQDRIQEQQEQEKLKLEQQQQQQQQQLELQQQQIQQQQDANLQQQSLLPQQQQQQQPVLQQPQDAQLQQPQQQQQQIVLQQPGQDLQQQQQDAQNPVQSQDVNNARIAAPLPDSNQIPYQQNIQYPVPNQSDNAAVNQIQMPQNPASFDQLNQAPLAQNQAPLEQQNQILNQPAQNQAPMGNALTTKFPQQPLDSQRLVNRSPNESQYDERQVENPRIVNEAPLGQNIPQEYQQQDASAPLGRSNEIQESPLGIQNAGSMEDRQQDIQQQRENVDTHLIGQEADQAQYIARDGNEMNQGREEIGLQPQLDNQMNNQQSLQFAAQVAQIPDDIRQ